MINSTSVRTKNSLVQNDVLKEFEVTPLYFGLISSMLNHAEPELVRTAKSCLDMINQLFVL